MTRRREERRGSIPAFFQLCLVCAADEHKAGRFCEVLTRRYAGEPTPELDGRRCSAFEPCTAAEAD